MRVRPGKVQVTDERVVCGWVCELSGKIRRKSFAIFSVVARFDNVSTSVKVSNFLDFVMLDLSQPHNNMFLSLIFITTVIRFSFL